MDYVRTELDESDLNFIVRECGGIAFAALYCEKIAAVNGPLSNQYKDAASRLRVRLRRMAEPENS